MIPSPIGRLAYCCIITPAERMPHECDQKSEGLRCHTTGEVSERPKEHAWKACMGSHPSRVRIPPSPPENADKIWIIRAIDGKRIMSFLTSMISTIGCQHGAKPNFIASTLHRSS